MTYNLRYKISLVSHYNYMYLPIKNPNLCRNHVVNTETTNYSDVWFLVTKTFSV